MAKRLYVGNLPDTVTDEDLLALFRQAGTVESAGVVRDPDTGRSGGFGFVEMATDADADNAIQMLDGYDIDGGPIEVSPARERDGYPPAAGGLEMAG